MALRGPYGFVGRGWAGVVLTLLVHIWHTIWLASLPRKNSEISPQHRECGPSSTVIEAVFPQIVSAFQLCRAAQSGGRSLGCRRASSEVA